MTSNENITIQGKTKDKVIIDAWGLTRIFTIDNNLNVTFININFINWYVVQDGVIYNDYENTTMTFIKCAFAKNHTT